MILSAVEKRILESIFVASENDPQRPEFPPDKPRFPATPTYQIKVPSFTNVWLKDESHNPTGTHKDRMAWEMVVTYRELLLAKEKGRVDKLPQMSLISSGSAALAIQFMLKKYNLPNLNVLVDHSMEEDVKTALRNIGCAIFETDLAKKPLTTDEILQLTNNPEGIDITSDDRLGPNTRFYDWMSYEILNSSPEFCLIPYGTGNLYENILNILHDEASKFIFHDPRLKGDMKKLTRCHFIGSTTNSPSSKADKLYSHHLPFMHFDKQWLKLLISKGFCGSLSGVYVFQEKFITQAYYIAQKQKINCEPSGIAGLAMLLQMQRRIPKNAKILIVSTGRTKYELARVSSK